ncbi:MAG: glycosyltransferase family 39 protein [Caldilineaceae bacterium]
MTAQPIRTWWWASLGCAILANIVILSPVPLLLKSIGVLSLTGLLPGAFFVEWLVGRSDAPPSRWEFALYAIGAGYSTMVIITLVLSYLPGGLTRGETLIAFDLWLLLLILPVWLRPLPLAPCPLPLAPRPYWLLIGILSLALVGGFLRFTHLGYAEFQGDEARLTLRAAAIIQGEENVLFRHQKGPTEILLPTVLYALTDRLTETTARLPFAIANFTALFALFLLGWRLFGPVAGWTAAMLLALDGYIIGFARVVQYQSIVLLMVILVVLIFYRLAQQPQALTRYFTLAALFLATGLLSHYEAALALFPVAYLLWCIWRRGAPLLTLVRVLMLPLLLGGLILASFYAPFVLKPTFANTYAYLTGYRMGGSSGPYNHLAEFFDRTTVYSSTYYLLLLIGLAVIGLCQLYWRNLPKVWRWLASALLVVGLAQTFHAYLWLKIGSTDYIWLFFASALVLAWLLPKFSTEERLVWLWFGGPMLLALFFTAIPNTHVYGFFIAWLLVAGSVIERGWQALSKRWSLRTAQLIALPIALSAILIFGLYEYWYFVYNEVEVLRTWQTNHPRGYWVTYDKPVDIAIFGFPLNNGWKAVAALYAQGVLHGNYETNVRDTVADWYTRGAHNCARDVPNYYFLANPVEPGFAADTAKLRRRIQKDHDLFGTVFVQGRPGLEIYQMGKNGVKPQQFPLEQYANYFDQQLASPHFEPNGPVGSPAIQHPLNVRFDDTIWLKGYTLDQTETQPDGRLELTLYWQTTQPVKKDYFVFVQAIDLKDFHKAGQRDGQPGCNNDPTASWIPGDIIADHYTLPIEPDALPGAYSLLTGLYIGDQRLEVHLADGQPAGNQFELTQIHVK